MAIIGGHSFGGRVASLLAAEERPRGLVLLSYPLHPPGKPAWESRVDHWPKIDCPVLLLSGEADPFARIDLLRQAISALQARGAGDLSHGASRPQAGARRRPRPDRAIRDRLD